MKEMTMKEAQDLFLKGEKILLCDYRFGKAEVINYRDKTDGKAKSFTTVRHTIEIGDASYQVSERVPEGFDAANYKPTISKGQRCVLLFDRFAVQSGVGQFGGTIVPVAK